MLAERTSSFRLSKDALAVKDSVVTLASSAVIRCAAISLDAGVVMYMVVLNIVERWPSFQAPLCRRGTTYWTPVPGSSRYYESCAAIGMEMCCMHQGFSTYSAVSRSTDSAVPGSASSAVSNSGLLHLQIGNLKPGNMWFGMFGHE